MSKPKEHNRTHEKIRATDEDYAVFTAKLSFVGCNLCFWEANAYLWIEFPDGNLAITEQDLLELNEYTPIRFIERLLELRTERVKDFRRNA